MKKNSVANIVFPSGVDARNFFPSTYYNDVFTEDEADAYGCKVTHKVISPDMCIYGDEVGGNLSMKEDGHVGGKLLLGERGYIVQKK